MAVETEELSGRAAVEMSALLDASVCVHLGSEGASGSLHCIKSLCSLLVFSRLCWPVSSNERDANVIQQGYRDTTPSEDDGIGRKLWRNIPRRQDQNIGGKKIPH